MRSSLSILLCLIAAHSTFAGRCVYYDQPGEGYSCRLEDALYETPNAEFVIQGVHLQGRANADVKVLFTSNSVLHFVPLQIFDQFQNLEQVFIHNAGLRELNAPLRNCGQLSSIRFSNNNMTNVPRSIFELCGNVTTISFLNSSIEQIDPLAFNLLHHLETIVIQDNPISWIHPDTFETVRNLTTLSLQGNGLVRVHPRLFTPLHNLKTINLDGNRIETIEPATFLNLPSLRSIHLNNNFYLNEIQPLAFALMENLELLSLRSANLSELSSNSFLTLPELQTINLRDNHVGKIERNFFDHFPSLISVDFRGNDCVDQWLRASAVTFELDECYERFDLQGQTTTTTLGASSVTLSFGLLLSTFILAKLSNQSF